MRCSQITLVIVTSTAISTLTLSGCHSTRNSVARWGAILPQQDLPHHGTNSGRSPNGFPMTGLMELRPDGEGDIAANFDQEIEVLVVDTETQQPISGAGVSVWLTGRRHVTNDQGKLTMKVKRSVDAIQLNVDAPGRRPTSVPIHRESFGNGVVTIRLGKIVIFHGETR